MSTDKKSRPEDRKDRLLDVAQSFIQTVGYNGFSYRDIAEVVGIKSASIHHHFPKKEDLGAAVTIRYREEFEAELSAISDKGSDLLSILSSYLTLFNSALSTEGHMCLCGMLGSEATSIPDKVRVETTAFFNMNIAWLSGHLKNAGSNNKPLTAKQAETKAQLLFASLEGAMMFAKAHGSLELFDKIGNAAIAEFLD